MSQTPLQTIIDPGTDPTLSVYATNAQNVPVINSATVVITNTNQYITEIYNLKAVAGGNVGEIEFNDGSGLAGDTGLTYDAESDSLTVSGNVFAGNIRTDSLQYANGTSYVFGSDYSNSNVASYLPTYNGTITAGNVVSTGNSNAATFNGSGAGLTNLPAANVVGNVANATFATTAGVANSVAGANVSGTVANATYSITSGTAYSVSGSNVSGAVSSATTATTAVTITANSQPNITSIGTLSSLSVTANVSAGNISLTGNANVARINVSTTANLGLVGNVKITGGSASQYLQTDGAGNLTWATVAGATTPNLQEVTTANAETNVAVVFTNDTESLSFNSGAVKITGGLGVAKAIHTQTHIAAAQTVYAGQYSSDSSWVVPKFVGRDAGATYIQGALVNITPTGSADWVSYNDASPSDGTQGWIDMGYTGSNFNDPLYTITKSNDGYVFVQGLTDILGGNLILATGDIGLHKDIIFATGGYLEENESMRLDDERNIFFVGGHAHTGLSDKVVSLDVNGNAKVGGELTIKNHNGHGGAGFAGMVSMENDTASNGKKFIRIDSDGKLQIINNAYSDTIFDLADNGDIIVSGNIMPVGNVAKDIGNATHRFKDLYLSGTTIDLGGTLIQAQSNGEVSIGNATFSSSGKISAADVSLTVSALSANTVASLSDAGKMLTYDGISPITYGIPNNATTSFATGSRIELLALSQAVIIVEPDGGSGVTLLTSKDLNVNNPTISNIQSATLTKIGTDTWYLGL